jgi:hypothetical protein
LGSAATGTVSRPAAGLALGVGVDGFQLALHRGHVHLVVVQRVQRGGGGAGHPGGVGAGLRVADLLLEHRGHQVGHGPHALADLRLAAQPALQPDQHVAALVGLDPGAALHVALADHRPGLHGGVHLVAGAVQEAGVDEGHAAAAAAMQALRLTLVRRSSSMMPSLTVFSGRPSSASTRPNSSLAKATSAGPCIFGLTM